MNVLLLGSGGREHAMAIAIAKSSLLSRLYVAPGNPGIAEFATCLPVDPTDVGAVLAACRAYDIAFVVVGPEAPLVAGVVDALGAAGIAAFGPSKAAAQLEGSKGFTKDFCIRHGIPTAAYRRCADLGSANAYLAEVGAPIVIKADGLAAGKGVTVAETLDDAKAAVSDIFGGAFGAAGASVVIEEVLSGEEASFFAVCDGQRAVPFASAQDHKRVGEGNTGPNTGGMGAYSPAPVVNTAMQARIMDEIVTPTMAGMAAEGMPFKGVLFAGLMIGAEGPKLIEYNVRFGDPETQAMLARFEGDFLALLISASNSQIDQQSFRFSNDIGLTVVVAASGYPGPPQKGGLIRNLDEIHDVTVTHAGTKKVEDKLLADGGRVLNVTALAPTVSAARDLAYAAINQIDWPDGFWRRDIGLQAVQ